MLYFVSKQDFFFGNIMLIYKHGLFVGAVLLLGGCYGQVAPLYPSKSDLTSESLVAAGSIGIVAFSGQN